MDLTRRNLRFYKKKTNYVIALWTAGSIIKNPRGSLENKPSEGVRVNLNRWIESGRLILDGRERERERSPEKKADATATMNGGEEARR